MDLKAIVMEEESYFERRLLFKDIWKIATQDKNKNFHTKVIKTLRVSAGDIASKSKVERKRIKNLKTTCNKVLKYCNKHDFKNILTEKALDPPRHTFTRGRWRSKKRRKIKPRVVNAPSPLIKEVNAATSCSVAIYDSCVCRGTVISRKASLVKVTGMEAPSHGKSKRRNRKRRRKRKKNKSEDSTDVDEHYHVII